MSRTQRFALLGLAVVVVVVAAVIIGTSGGGSDVTRAPARRRSTVKDAKPVGGVKTITYKKGDTIDLTVKSATPPTRSTSTATTCTRT